jgi:hypothetical protein
MVSRLQLDMRIPLTTILHQISAAPLIETLDLLVEPLKFVGAEAAIQATTESTGGDFDRAYEPVRIPVVSRIRAFSPIHSQGEVLSPFAAESDAAHWQLSFLVPRLRPVLAASPDMRSR